MDSRSGYLKCLHHNDGCNCRDSAGLRRLSYLGQEVPNQGRSQIFQVRKRNGEHELFLRRSSSIH